MPEDAFQTARREVYAASLADFTPTRARLAAEAKKAGARDLAKEIVALRKPTRGAWTVNQLAHRTAGALAQLFELADALRAAQTSLDGPQLRALAVQRRQVVDALVEQALRETDQDGAPESLRVEVRSTLEAALADSDVRAEVRAGLLVRAAQFSGFGELSGPTLSLVPDTKIDQTVSPRRAAPTSKHSGKPASPAKRPRAQEAAKHEAAEAAEQASAELERKRAAAQQKIERQERQRADAVRTQARTAAAAADSALSAAVEAEKDGSRQVRIAQEQLADARRRLDDARLDVRRARSEQAKAVDVVRKLR